MVADFQIANQEQKTFLQEIKKEIPLTHLYEFLHDWEYSIQISKLNFVIGKSKWNMMKR